MSHTLSNEEYIFELTASYLDALGIFESAGRGRDIVKYLSVYQTMSH